MAWTTVKTDAFTGTSGLNLNQYNAGWKNSTAYSGNYLGLTGSNSVYRLEGAQFAVSYWDGSSIGNDQAAQIAIVDATKIVQLLSRWSDAGSGNWNGYLASWDGSVVQVLKVTSGVFSQIGADISTSFSNGDVFRMEVTGSSTVTIKCLKNGVQVGTDRTDSSSPHTSGYTGLRSNAASAAMDNFQADEWSSGGGGSRRISTCIVG